MDIYREAPHCRVCAGSLAPLLDLGEQCLGGQFPAPGEPDPPRAPLVMGQCGACGLVQLLHTVRPELMFTDYWYRSSVSVTMRKHLTAFARQAVALVKAEESPTALDIGCNDGTLLRAIPPYWGRVGIDPADVGAVEENGIAIYRDWFPSSVLRGRHFDLIFTVACFYDADKPVEFAQSVASLLTPKGLWCLEVADLEAMLDRTAYDVICHEHLVYYSLGAIQNVLAKAGLRLVAASRNDCNGGTLRVYARLDHRKHKQHFVRQDNPKELSRFVESVKLHWEQMSEWLIENSGKQIHLLGASTKAGTWMQCCGADVARIAVASDRDPRKFGRRTPGTNIPIVSEEASRQAKPDIYLVGPWHFRTELIEREQDFLAHGGRLVFPLPRIEEVVK